MAAADADLSIAMAAARVRDAEAVGADVLRHRLILTYEAEAENITTDDLVRVIESRIGPKAKRRRP